MNRARFASSLLSEERPDFESSPEVLNWMKTFSRDSRSSGQFLLSAVASFWDETVWTVWRFGTANVSLCHHRKSPRRPSSRTGYEFRFVRLEGSDKMPVYVFG